MNIHASIEARMTSSRLPGKVLKKINNTPSLEIMIHRIQKSKHLDKIIVATTINKEDDPIVQWCIENNIHYFRGSEKNIYERVLQAHEKFNTDIIVKLTGDCPLLDAPSIDKIVDIYKNNSYDYVSTSENYPLGIGVEVFSKDILQSISLHRELEYQDKEHVSPYLYTSNNYTCFYLEPIPSEYLKNLSITLDTQEDFEVISNICKNFNHFDFSLAEIITFCRENESLINLNQNIHRKGLD